MTISDTGQRLLVSANGTAPAAVRRRGTDGNIWNFWKDNTNVGSVSVTTAGTAYNTTSDERLKELVGDLSFETAMNVLRLIQVHEFIWKVTGEQDIGVFAQELYQVYPRAVTVGEGSPGEPGFQPWGVDYSKLMSLVVAALQGFDQRLAALEAASGVFRG